MGNNNTTFLHSPMKITKKKIIWTIENFSAREKETGEYLTGEFTSYSPSGKLVKWKLCIYPKGHNKETNEYVSISISLMKCDVAQVSAKFEFYFLDSKRVGREKKTTRYYNISQMNEIGSKLFKRDMLLNEKNCPNDLLTIVCKIKVRSEKIIVDTKKANFKIPACRLIKNINKLFEEKLFTDCLIMADDGKEFMVHKCILAGQSTVFAALFKNQLVDEVESGTIKIDKFNSEVLEQLFRFIYSGEAPKMKEMAKDLLAAADKFQLERLKILCEIDLVESLETGNVCEFLVLASSHSAEHLKTKAIEYIKQHGKEVKESSGWEMLTKEHLQLFV